MGKRKPKTPKKIGKTKEVGIIVRLINRHGQARLFELIAEENQKDILTGTQRTRRQIFDALLKVPKADKTQARIIAENITRIHRELTKVLGLPELNNRIRKYQEMVNLSLRPALSLENILIKIQAGTLNYEMSFGEARNQNLKYGKPLPTKAEEKDMR